MHNYTLKGATTGEIHGAFEDVPDMDLLAELYVLHVLVRTHLLTAEQQDDKKAVKHAMSDYMSAIHMSIHETVEVDQKQIEESVVTLTAVLVSAVRVYVGEEQTPLSDDDVKALSKGVLSYLRAKM